MSPDLEAQSPTSDRPVIKGYLKKLFSKKKERFFVLRDHPVARLEYFENEKKFNTKGSKPKRSIDLRKAWNIDKKTCAKHKFVISIYTQNEYFAMAADNKQTQETWVNCLHSVTAACNANIQMYKHIWQVVLDNKEIEHNNSTKYISLQGPHRCCLTENAMILVKLDNNGNVSDLKRHVEVKMASIRTCGHRENRFFIEPGRSLGIGTGKLWMDLDDPVIADNMHQTILSIMYSLKSDDGCPRPRSYSSGSGTCRRYRREYNPPPSQVGMGKPPTINPPSVVNQLNKPRTRCESFPATHVGGLADELRYRTSSEGETTMKFLRNNKFKNGGSASPGSRWSRPRGGSQGKRFAHYNTISCHGSYTSSSSLSSIDHPGSSTVSEGLSSDEYSSSPCDHFQRFGRSITPDSTSSAYEEMSFPHCICQAAPPPPPSFAPQPLRTNISHEYVNTQPLHSRSHSMDDNLSCGMDASSLSTSPNHLNAEEWQGNDSEYAEMGPSTVSEGNYYAHQQTKSQEQPMDTSEEYSDMSFPYTSSAVQKHTETNATEDYAIMTPGKPTTPIDVATKEDSEGYVTMRPYSIAKSLPQDIDMRHRTTLTNKYTSGSYSPKSDMSRSPDKVANKLSTTSSFRKTTQPGFILESDSSKPVLNENVQDHALPNYCSDSYAEMSAADFNQYLVMSPMSMGNNNSSNKVGLFETVLSVAKSGVRSTLQYPHQLGNTENTTNSLDRKKSSSKSLKRNKSNNSYKVDRKMSLKIVTDLKQDDQSGGEYVNIDLQKALQHPSYLSTSPSLLKKIRHKTLGHGEFHALKNNTST